MLQTPNAKNSSLSNYPSLSKNENSSVAKTSLTAQGRSNPLSTIGAAYGKPSASISRTLFNNSEFNFKNPAPQG